jgi:hypothetical protein
VWQWFLEWMRRWFRWIICAIRRWFLAPNERSIPCSECIYGWTAAYRIVEESCALRITVRIRLNPDADVTADEIAALRAVWEPGIEERWSNRFLVSRLGGDCGCTTYAVTFDAQFVDADEHHLVRVVRGPGRSNMRKWHTDDTAGIAAHEFGHMLTFPDEYADEECPDRFVATDESIMRTTAGDPMTRHYQPFATWVSNRTCCEYGVSVG